MYGNLGVQRYKETNINSLSREKMIVMLYEKMQSDLMGAARALENEDRLELVKLVNHSQRIVSELRGALDHSIGGDVSRNLENLYDYLFHEHLQVTVDLNPRHIENCLQVIQPLLNAWRQIPSGTGDRAAKEQALGISGPENAPVFAEPQEAPPEKPAGAPSLLSVSA